MSNHVSHYRGSFLDQAGTSGLVDQGRPRGGNVAGNAHSYANHRSQTCVHSFDMSETESDPARCNTRERGSRHGANSASPSYEQFLIAPRIVYMARRRGTDVQPGDRRNNTIGNFHEGKQRHR